LSSGFHKTSFSFVSKHKHPPFFLCISPLLKNMSILLHGFVQKSPLFLQG